MNYTETIKELVYDCCLFKLTDYTLNNESNEYAACNYLLNQKSVISRTAKITPKKIGQFVVLWKRIDNGPIMPYSCVDVIDYIVVNVKEENNFGQFVFPKKELIKQGVFSTDLKEGKRAIRVYPPWVEVKSRQACKSQEWQLKYFLFMTSKDSVDLNRARTLYSLV